MRHFVANRFENKILANLVLAFINRNHNQARMKRFASDSVLGDSWQHKRRRSDNYINFVIKLRELARNKSLGLLRCIFEYGNFGIGESLVGVSDV